MDLDVWDLDRPRFLGLFWKGKTQLEQNFVGLCLLFVALLERGKAHHIAE